ncbi:MAG TPA: AAA family ATPase [Bacteroidia bacterium]|nr:AAA family ATPase [Bacteroidia bacterium]
MKVKKFSIKNYRSLKEISIDQFDATTIFYGNNNAGKSNILNALELIFKRKQILDQVGLTAPQTFLIGDIPDSKNNFYNNETHNPIAFNVDIEVGAAELNISHNISTLFSKQENYLFSFTGGITFDDKGEGDYSTMKIEEISANKAVIYSNTDKTEYFPTIKQTSKETPELASAFNSLIDIFNDCVYIVSSDRDMHDTSINDENASVLSPKTFKKYLYNLYLSPQKFHLFEEINEVFSKPPFSYGTISFSEEADHKLQLMVKESGFRLPIKHLGSGVLQSLYIITSIIDSRKKIVCIEELEQNLSPVNQYKILNKIQSMITDPKSYLDQLIISSHSAVYAKPRLGGIYFLVKETGRTVVKSFIKKTVKGEKVIKPETDSHIDKDLEEHLSPNKQLWTDEVMWKYMKREHDFKPFGEPPLPKVVVKRQEKIEEDIPSENEPKPAKEASTTFHNIMAASVKGNPKPKKKTDKKK